MSPEDLGMMLLIEVSVVTDFESKSLSKGQYCGVTGNMHYTDGYHKYFVVDTVVASKMRGMLGAIV